MREGHRATVLSQMQWHFTPCNSILQWTVTNAGTMDFSLHGPLPVRHLGFVTPSLASVLTIYSINSILKEFPPLRIVQDTALVLLTNFWIWWTNMARCSRLCERAIAPHCFSLSFFITNHEFSGCENHLMLLIIIIHTRFNCGASKQYNSNNNVK